MALLQSIITPTYFIIMIICIVFAIIDIDEIEDKEKAGWFTISCVNRLSNAAWGLFEKNSALIFPLFCEGRHALTGRFFCRIPSARVDFQKTVGNQR